jgi:GAF domain-containing protein
LEAAKMQPNQESVNHGRAVAIQLNDEQKPSAPRVKSPIADFGIPKDELAYQAKGDASVLVEAWRKLDLAAHPHMKEARSFVLTEWEKRTELHGRHDEPTVFQRHADFFQTLASIKYSSDDISNPNAMLSLLIPGTMEPAWCTPAMDQVQWINDHLTEDMKKFHNCAGVLILLYRLYGDKLDLSHLPLPNPRGLQDVVSYQPDPNGPVRYYRIRMDNEVYSSQSWSVKMEVDGELPPLTQKDIERILINPYDPDHIRSIVDTHKLIINGLMFVWAEDITRYFQVSRFQKQLATNAALLRRRDLDQLQDQLRSDLQIPKLEVGLLFSPFDKESRQACWRPHLRSLRFSAEMDPGTLDPDDAYLQAFDNPIIINALSETPGLDELKKRGLESVLIAPLIHHDEVIGLVEFGAPRSHVFDYAVVSQILVSSGHMAAAVKQIFDGENERIMAVIKQTCTAIHPSVEWRFQQMAREYIKQIENDELQHPDPVVFKDVIPLFGVSDIRHSSRNRNESIQADLEHQLRLAADVIIAAEQTHSQPVFDELGYRIRQHQASLAEGLKSGDEARIYSFLKQVVETAFDELSSLSAETEAKVQAYRRELDPEVGVIYHRRKNYDQSVRQINDHIGAYIDTQQEHAQRMIPHYFEKFKTDGVDHNIYVGDSLLESGSCSPLALRNLYLWQLMCMCGVVWLMRELKPKLATPLDTAHLILLQSTPLNITFQPEEKHFSVDGTYNARYEIVKKRIDKACILKTGERLTQPEQIAIVYTQERELKIYRELISYLQELGYLEMEFIDVVLEDLQGVHGLRALRVNVAETPPDAWNSKDGHARLGMPGV